MKITKKQIIILLTITIIIGLGFVSYISKINRINNIVNSTSLLNLDIQLATIKLNSKNPILSCKNYFTIKYLLKSIKNQDTAYWNRKLCVLLIMLSSSEMYNNYKVSLDKIFYNALKNADNNTLETFANYYPNIATNHVLDKLIMLAKRPATELTAIRGLARMRYDIDCMTKLSHALDINSKIILLGLFYKKSAWEHFSDKDISYYKKLIEKYNLLIYQEIISNQSFYKSVYPVVKMRLTQIWVSNNLHLDTCRIILDSISVDILEDNNDKIKYFIERARLSEKLKKYDLSAKYLEKALNFSSNPSTFFLEANTSMENQNWIMGSKFMEKYLELEYGKDWISVIKKNHEEQDVLNIATFWQQAGIKPKEVEDLLKYLVYKRQNLEAENFLAYFWAEQNKNLPEALKLIQEVLRNEPNNANFIDTYGYVLYKQKKYKAALKEFLKANALQLDNTVIKEHLGDVYQKLGKTKESKKYWKEALKLLKKEKYRPDNQRSIKEINAKLKMVGVLSKN